VLDILLPFLVSFSCVFNSTMNGYFSGRCIPEVYSRGIECDASGIPLT